jgi:hypothetical protein
MTKDEREKLREFATPINRHPEEYELVGAVTAISFKDLISLLDYCDKLEDGYSDHMVVYEALLDEQKKTEALEARCEKLESRLGKYLDAMEIFVVAMREASDCVAEDEQALAQGDEGV